jgi:hypothetical protein
MIADVAAALALIAASYEATAVWTDKVPTITTLVNKTPKLVRAAGLAGAAAWALHHFRVL